MSKHTLTHGPIEQQLISLTLPLIAGNILQQLYNAVDAVIIGRYEGQAAFAAIGVSGTVMNLFLFIISGCCTGMAVLFARHYGEQDMAAFRRQHWLCFLWGGGITLVGSLFAGMGLKPLLQCIRTPAELEAYCRQYLSIIAGGLICAYFYNLFSAMLRAAGNTRIGLVVLALSMVCNLGLDMLFIIRLKMGIGGAACATVFSQLLSAALCCGYICKKYPELLFRKEDRKQDQEMLREIGHYSLVSALQQSSLYLGKLLVQGAVNGMGVHSIAAYTATTRIEGFANSFCDSGATALSMFISQNLGAGQTRRMKEALKKGSRMMLVLCGLLSLIMAATAPWTVEWMLGSGDPLALQEGVGYLRIIACCYFLCFMGSSFVGWYRGVGMMSVPTIGSTMHISVRVIFSYLLAEMLGLRAVAVASGAGWCLVVSYHIYMLRAEPSRGYLNSKS